MISVLRHSDFLFYTWISRNFLGERMVSSLLLVDLQQVLVLAWRPLLWVIQQTKALNLSLLHTGLQCAFLGGNVVIAWLPYTPYISLINSILQIIIDCLEFFMCYSYHFSLYPFCYQSIYTFKTFILGSVFFL